MDQPCWKAQLRLVVGRIPGKTAWGSWGSFQQAFVLRNGGRNSRARLGDHSKTRILKAVSVISRRSWDPFLWAIARRPFECGCVNASRAEPAPDDEAWDHSWKKTWGAESSKRHECIDVRHHNVWVIFWLKNSILFLRGRSK